MIIKRTLVKLRLETLEMVSLLVIHCTDLFGFLSCKTKHIQCCLAVIYAYNYFRYCVITIYVFNYIFGK
jgi:hypothetical protein